MAKDAFRPWPTPFPPAPAPALPRRRSACNLVVERPSGDEPSPVTCRLARVGFASNPLGGACADHAGAGGHAPFAVAELADPAAVRGAVAVSPPLHRYARLFDQLHRLATG